MVKESLIALFNSKYSVEKFEKKKKKSFTTYFYEKGTEKIKRTQPAFMTALNY